MTTQILFTAVDADGNDSLFATDSATGQTRRLKSFEGADVTLATTGRNHALLTVSAGGTTDLWSWNGLRATLLLSQANPGQLTTLPNGQTLFTARDDTGGRQVWITDGTSAGTRVVSPDLHTAANDWTVMMRGDGKALLLGSDDSGALRIWATDGTQAGTTGLLTGATTPSDPTHFSRLDNGKILFMATDPAHGQELWITDGTAAGTQLVRDIAPGTTASNLYGAGIVPIGGGKALLHLDNTLWSTDGTPDGTVAIMSLSDTLFIRDLTALGDGRAMIVTEASGTPITGGYQTQANTWITNGTVGGTTRLNTTSLLHFSYPYYPHTDQSPASDFLRLGNGRIIFSNTDSQGTELWASDGTAAGTGRPADLSRGMWPIFGPTGFLTTVDMSSRPSSFLRLANGNAIFSAQSWGDPKIASGNHLWVTDGRTVSPLTGSTPGTYPASLLAPTPLGDGRIVFVSRDYGTDGSVSEQLWITDGTTAGTRRLTDLATPATGIDLTQSDSVIQTLGLLTVDISTRPTAGNDQLIGTSSADRLDGLGGNDYLLGQAGNDTLIGGSGADTLEGGAGNDTYVVDSTADVVVELAGDGTDLVQAAVSWTLGDHVESLTLTGTAGLGGTGNALANLLTGNTGANRLEGAAGNDTLNGGAGADTLIGGAGDDIYVVDNAKDVITETADGGIDTVQSTLAWTLADNLEHLTLLDKATNATGNAAANVLDGKAGADTMIGGAGNDTYYVDNVGDIVTELAGGGTDTVFTTLASWTLPAEVDNLTLAGSAAGNATGNALANTLTGNAAANVLDGGLGADTMIGGAGDDTYVVDNAKDTVTEAANAGTDAVQSSISWTLGKNLENLTLTGTAAINATGNELANVLQGNAGNNTLDGGLGNDTYLVGRGSGADLIKDNDTKAGNLDTLRFLEGIATDQLWFRKVGSNLEVSIIGTADKATIDGWYTNSKFRVEQFQTSAGKTLAMGKVDALVSAMAGLTPPAMGQTTLSTDYQSRLSDVLAKSWS
jgi:ELWxxDGT repeat protein